MKNLKKNQRIPMKKMTKTTPKSCANSKVEICQRCRKKYDGHYPCDNCGSVRFEDIENE